MSREGVNDNPASGDKHGRGGLADFLGGVTVRKMGHWKAMDQGLFRDMDNTCFPKDTSFRNDQDYHWWVICVGKEPVAYAGMEVVAWTGDGKKIKRVRFTRCGVLPKYRGLGFQRRLIAARLRWCRRMGVHRVETYTDLKNEHSRRNLLEAGFKSRRRGEWYNYRMDLR